MAYNNIPMNLFSTHIMHVLSVMSCLLFLHHPPPPPRSQTFEMNTKYLERVKNMSVTCIKHVTMITCAVLIIMCFTQPITCITRQSRDMFAVTGFYWDFRHDTFETSTLLECSKLCLDDGVQCTSFSYQVKQDVLI